MILEHLNRSHNDAVDMELNSKLYLCGYPTAPVETTAAYKEEKDKQSSQQDNAAKRAKEPTETPEQRIDQKIKDRFGKEVYDHLKDWDWLIENRKKLEDGFKKASNQDAWDMAWRMNELSSVDGKPLIYLSKVEGPTKGNLIPKRHDIYLRRGSLRSDDYIGQLYR